MACAVAASYHPAPWEQMWRANVSRIADASELWLRGCTVILDESEAIRTWLETAAARRERSDVPWAEAVMSYHAWTNSCTGRVLATVPIEPLVGTLRHPLFHCFRLDSSLRKRGARGVAAHHATGRVAHSDRLSTTRFEREDFGTALNKSYLLPSWADELTPRPRRAFLFDLGASTYAAGAGGASQQWFVETYARQGIHFERIFAWEATPHQPHRLFQPPMPEAVLDALSYYNVPLSATPGARHNPLRTLRAVARANDFVVLKVDFDTPALERALVEQVLTPEISPLVDELYFEHHVHDSPLSRYKYGPKVGPDQDHLHDSYELFSRLREAGIRAHSWV